MSRNMTPDGGLDDEQPLDASDLSEGDVVELELSNYGNARYEVEGEWNDEDTADLESLDRPDEDAEGMFPGLKARRVWTENPGDYRDLPRYRATLVLDADTYTGGLVNNYPDEDDEDNSGYVILSVQRAEVVEVEDRWNEEGSLDSGPASHVRRVVAEAFDEDPLVSTIEAENVTIKGADASGTGCLGNDLGVTVYVGASMDLHTREALDSYLNENLNADYWFEHEKSSVWTFLLDRDGETRGVR